MPDSNASRYNPSLKVYPATVEIEGTHDFLKPGMSAKVEIIVNELEDVTYVPVQAVFVENSERFVFLKTLGGYKRQVVEVGAYNNDFIELKKGIAAGDSVFLKMPDSYEPAKLEKSQTAKGTAKRKAENDKTDKAAAAVAKEEARVESDKKA